MIFDLKLSGHRVLNAQTAARKKRIKTKEVDNTAPYTELDTQIYDLGTFYSLELHRYSSSPRKFWKAGLTKHHKSWSYFEKTLQIAKTLDMDPRDYIRAQFWWFHKHMQIAPRPHDLIRGAAYALEWKRIYGASKDYFVAPRAHEREKVVELSNNAEMVYYINLLQTLCRNWRCPETQIYQNFGALFPLTFLETRPLWQQWQRQQQSANV